MSDFFVGEIRLFPFNVVPQYWLRCEGQELTVQQYVALYSLIGFQFGGNGSTKFNLPDLRGRVIAGVGSGQQVGSAGGAETVALSIEQIPEHQHAVRVTTIDGTAALPTGRRLAASATNPVIPTAVSLFAPPSAQPVGLNSGVVDAVGGGGGHNNMQPYLAMSYCIATNGIYPYFN